MNDDDLEERLARLRPAAPPRDLLCSLRAAAPVVRGGGWAASLCAGWRMRLAVCAGVAAVAVLAAWQAAIRHGATSSRLIPATGTSGGRAVAASPLLLPAGGDAPWVDDRTTAFEDDAPGQRDSLALPPDEPPGGRYAFLADLMLRPADARHLGLPAGPLRLDSGYRLFDLGSGSSPTSNFSLGNSEPF